MSAVVWMHEDCLRPILPGAPAIFVFGPAERSLKRLVFVYECLLELDVTIARGDVVPSVRAFAAVHGATRIVTAYTECPEIMAQAAELGAEVLVDDPFVETDERFDLARFSRYWRRMERLALRR